MSNLLKTKEQKRWLSQILNASWLLKICYKSHERCKTHTELSPKCVFIIVYIIRVMLGLAGP